MLRPQRLFTALVLVTWVGMVLACGGAGNGSGRAKKDPGTADPAGQPSIPDAGSDRETTPEKTVNWKGKLGTGKLGTGATAYDELPNPWRSQFVKAWKGEVAACKAAITSAEESLEKSKGAAAKAQDELTKFETKYKADLRDGLTQSAHKDRKVALTKAQAFVKNAEAVLAAAKERLADVEANDPPYFEKPFEGCKTPQDIENRLAAIDAQKRAEDVRRNEEENRRRAEADKRRAEEELEVNGLVLLTKTTQGVTNEFGGEVTGSVVNRTGKKLRYAQITFNLYDDSGAQVGSALANINGLEPGGRWNFKATAFGTKFKSYKFSDMSGF